MAKTRIEVLRYGREGKDYFWLQDTQPRIIMHPYREDLNGRDVSDYRDPRGVRIFVEFAEVVRKKHEGYVDYVWQWKDDPNRVAPKESYVKGFEPWGWIIGTGIYTEDVHREIALLQGRLVHVSVGISVVVALLLLYVLRQSLRLERQRSEAEESLRDSTERYRSLVEATTEGALLVLDGRCRYGNPVLLNLLGCSAQDLELLDLEDVIPPGGENETFWESMSAVVSSEEAAGGLEAALRPRDGRALECVVTLNPILFGGRRGVIVLVKPVGLSTPGPQDGGPAVTGRSGLLEQLSHSLTAGVFRATATTHGSVVACSRAAARLLSLGPDAASGAPLTLAGLFADPAAYEDFLSDLRRDGSAECHLHLATDTAETTTIALSAVLQTSAPARAVVDGVIQDVPLHAAVRAGRADSASAGLHAVSARTGGRRGPPAGVLRAGLLGSSRGRRHDRSRCGRGAGPRRVRRGGGHRHRPRSAPPNHRRRTGPADSSLPDHELSAGGHLSPCQRVRGPADHGAARGPSRRG